MDGAKAYPVTEGAYATGLATTIDLRALIYEQDTARVYTSLFSDYVAGTSYKTLWTGWNAANPSLQNSRVLSDYGIGLTASWGSFSGQAYWSRKFAASEQSVISSTAANGRVWLSGSWSWR